MHLYVEMLSSVLHYVHIYMCLRAAVLIFFHVMLCSITFDRIHY